MTSPLDPHSPGDPLEPRIRALVAVSLDLQPSRLTPNALLAEDLGVDSLAAIELGMVLEDEFDISLPDQVLAEIRTYGECVAAVRERVAARPGQPTQSSAVG